MGFTSFAFAADSIGANPPITLGCYKLEYVNLGSFAPAPHATRVLEKIVLPRGYRKSPVDVLAESARV